MTASTQTGIGLLDRLRFSPFLAQMVVTRACNLRCGYCNEYSIDGQPVPLDRLKRQLDHIRALGAFAIEFTGGEPLLHPDLPSLICYAKELKFLKRMMISNAYLLTERSVADLNEAGLSEFQVSLDGVHPNPTTRKVLSLLEPKLRMLAEHATFKVQVNAVIGACPADEVLTVIRFALDLGFKPRVLIVHGPNGEIAREHDNLELLQEAQHLLGRRFTESGDYRQRLLREGSAPFRCRAGSRYLYVNEYGDVSWCSQTTTRFNQRLLTYGLYDLKRQFSTPKPCAEKCTVGCSRTCSAFDEWRRQELVKPKP